MSDPVLLSTNGSDRATTYPMSCKVVRHGDVLYAAWLDAPEERGEPSRIMLAACDARTGELRRSMLLGRGHDNHCGPALAIEPGGRVHAIIGAHGYNPKTPGSGDFLYRWSDTPEDERSWSEPKRLGPGDTYPSLVVDAAGTLHLAHRETGVSPEERWQLWYRRKVAGRPWESPKPLVVSPTRGYCNFQQSLTVGPSGHLHLVFHFRHGPSGLTADCRAVASAHLCSPDGGDTWLSGGQPVSRMPAEMEDLALIRHRPEGGLYISNGVVDAEDHPWFVSTDPDTPSGVLWHLTDGGWEALGLHDLFPGVGARLRPMRESISRDPSGCLHMVLPLLPEQTVRRGSDDRSAASLNSSLPESMEVYAGATGWFDPRLELYHLVVDGGGRGVSARRLTESTPPVAHWLPALEWWDWQRPEEACGDGPWLLYAVGLNKGGNRADNRNAVRTRVYLQHLATIGGSRTAGKPSSTGSSETTDGLTREQ